MTRWVLGQLAREAKRDPVKYNDFYQEFGAYIKEGACTDRVLRPTSQQHKQRSFVQLCKCSAAFGDKTCWFCVWYGQANMEAISKLLRFESSKPPPPLPAKDEDEDDEKKDEDKPTELKTVSLAQVNERVVDGQKHIFYLATPSRELATSSPYFEAFDAADVEVLYVYNDMVRAI